MVNLQKIDDSSVKFVFEDSDHYLFGDGEIVVPVNSLSLVIDDSEMVTFKKSATGDPFISFRPENSNLGTKEAIETFYKENMVGGSGGVSEEEVQEMIDAAMDGVWTDIDEKEEVIASALTEVRQDVADKQDALSAGTGIEISGNVISATGGSSVTVDSTLDSGSTNPVANSAITQAINDAKAYYISFATIATTGIRDEDWDGIVAAIDDHRPIYAGYPRQDGGILYYGVECMNKNSDNTQIILTSSDDSVHYFYTFTKNGSNDYSFSSETREYVSQAEKDAWDAKQNALSAGTGIEISGNVISATGGGSSINVVQTTGSSSADVMSQSAVTSNMALKSNAVGGYVFGETSGVDRIQLKSVSYSNIGSEIYYPKINGKGILTNALSWAQSNLNFQLVETSAITSAITSASTNAEVAGAKAVYDAIQAGGGGGATYSAGTNISIANDTINCTLPITANTKNYNVTVGYDLNVREEGETSIGKFNINRYINATTHSENTIFTVGNGGSNGLRHNALEIRKNGDLYFADTSDNGQSYYKKPMVRLQDMYGALGGLKFVKCTQAEYDALATKDANTLYIISNVVS